MNQSQSQDNPFEENNSLDMETRLSGNSKTYLIETAKWAKFLAIVGFIGLGLLVLGGLFLGIEYTFLSENSTNPEAAIGGMSLTVTVILMAVIYFFPSWYLFRFGKKTQRAFADYDTETFTEASQNLKSLFKFMGILTIIILAIYGIALLATILIAVMDVSAL